MNNFQLINYDTDSITICAPDGSQFTEAEQQKLIDGLNAQFPEKIKWEPDGYFSRVVVLKAKNYILQTGTKVKIKGSALKSAVSSVACKEFQKEIIQTILDEKYEYEAIYNKYVHEAMNVKDIKRWANKRTYTKKIDDSTRKNESKIKDAMVGSNYKEGEKLWVFFKEDKSLCLAENFTGEYDRIKMVQKIWNSAQAFENIIDTKTLFPKYHLKNKTLRAKLDDLLKDD